MLFTLAATEETKRFIERLAALGVEVEITELDARLRLLPRAANPHLTKLNTIGILLKPVMQLALVKA